MHPRRIILVVVIVLLIIAAGLLIHRLMRPHINVLSGTGPVTIILSPDFGDAVLSLGGFLAQHTQPAIVATFFTAAPQEATTTAWDQAAGFTDSTVAMNVRASENQSALRSLGAVPENYGYISNEYGPEDDMASVATESSIAEDIQALLVANAGRPVSIYGPADFGPLLTSADAQTIHDAFVDASSNFPSQNIKFFYYEPYPGVTAFDASSSVSLAKFLGDESDDFLTQTNIALSAGEVAAKISAIKQYQSLVQAYGARGTDIAAEDEQYTSSRCAGTACEVVYQIPAGIF